MNIFVIPSWYPSKDNPSTGIFFKEQSELYARANPEDNVGICTWGQNREDLLLYSAEPVKSISKLFSEASPESSELLSNCVEYFHPTHTWSRKFLSGNIDGILKACDKNWQQFESRFGKVDLIHAHVAYPGGYIAMKLAEKYDRPYVITEHMTPFPFESFIESGNISPFVQEPMVKAARIIAVSDHLSKVIHEKTGRNSIVANNFIDDDYFVPVKSKTHSERKSLLFIGRLEHQKGLDILLQTLSAMGSNLNQIQLAIGGSGSLEEDYRKLADDLHLNDHLVWLGELTRSEVLNRIQDCYLLVLPSRHENNPVILLEALACGKPILATYANGSEELVTSTNGRLAKNENILDLKDQLVKMIEELSSYDGVKIRSEFDKKHSFRLKTKELKSLYLDVLG